MSYQPYHEHHTARLCHDHKIPSGWEARRLKFASSYNDESLPETTDPDFEITYVDISSVDLVKGITAFETFTFEKAPSRARRIVRQGDTIISTVRTYLKAIAAIDTPLENMIVSTGFAVIRPLSFVNSRFLGYALQGSGFIDSVVANSKGVSYPAINASDLVSICVSYPQDTEEQEQIAKFLDYKTAQIDALIVKKTELIEKLKEQRVAVITQAVSKGLDPNTSMRDSGVDWLGHVPKHWEIKRLKFYIKSLDSGVSVNAEPFPASEDEAGILKTSCVYGNRFRPMENKRILIEELDRVACPTVKDSIIISRMNTPELVGHCGYVEQDYPNLYLPDRLWITRFHHDFDGSVKFFWYLLSSKGAQGITESLATGASGSMKNLTQPDYLGIRVAVPKIGEQETITRYLDTEVDRIQSLIKKTHLAIDNLNEYRRALITAATAGKIDVRNVKLERAK